VQPINFSLRQLQYAVAVADTLSFRKAAARCHVSQPSLSAQLAQLERTLDVRLFERDRRRVLPTAAGQELVERARRVLLEADDLAAAAMRAADPLTGTLRIGVIPTISPYLLPAITPALRDAFPRLTLRWTEDKTEVLIARLDAGELDAAILALEADIGNVDREVIARDPFVLATQKTNPLGSGRRPAHPEDLHGAPVLLLDDGHCFRDQALAVCATADAQELEFRATSLPTLAHMVAAGAGVTLLPALAAPTEARRADLAIRPFARPAPARTIALVWRRRSPLAAPLRSLAAVVRDAYPNPDILPRPWRKRSRER
jgi:LysR family transcriptional regulator, hydrogen peroxide-inducible genes activator